METVEIRIEVPADRTEPGILTVYRGSEQIAGPVRCLTESDRQAAAQAGNPSRDPMHPMGDTPLGVYWLTLLPPGLPEHSYGPGIRYLLNPAKGPALKAKKNGRAGIELHGGPLAPTGFLRPTHGCIRVDDSTIVELEKCGPWRCEVRAVLQSEESVHSTLVIQETTRPVFNPPGALF